MSRSVSSSAPVELVAEWESWGWFGDFAPTVRRFRSKYRFLRRSVGAEDSLWRYCGVLPNRQTEGGIPLMDAAPKVVIELVSS
jgi:hypothetical protein